MTIHLGWYVPDHVIVMILEGEFRVQEYNAAGTKLNELIDQSDDKIFHIIVDAREMTGIPKVADLLQVKRHQHSGWLYAIGVDHAMIKFLGAIALQTLGFRYRFVQSLAEAHEHLIDIIPALQEDKRIRDYQIIETFTDIANIQ